MATIVRHMREPYCAFDKSVEWLSIFMRMDLKDFTLKPNPEVSTLNLEPRHTEALNPKPKPKP